MLCLRRKKTNRSEYKPNSISSGLRELVEGGDLSGLDLILELLDGLNDIILTAHVILNDARELDVADTESQRLNVAGLRPLASLDGGSLDLLEQGLEIGGVVHGLDVNDHQGLLDLLVGGLLLLSLSAHLSLHLSGSLVVLVVVIITEEILVVVLFLLLLLLGGGGGSSSGGSRATHLQLELSLHNGELTTCKHLHVPEISYALLGKEHMWVNQRAR